ncbi:hypothetical protein [Kibdelosporangium aridum]|uniref:Uncharacterized protein n=1 Tax=Kibdelosporangium aridum TaxID=2030 RepID=A0A1W2FYS4_KIBAR|nr:hypothetical protein [Kibdelosporangium aridum]SMD26934.1 hypothetical protein SAMN05661093_10521 [Kibdelosporangium aridum]
MSDGAYSFLPWLRTGLSTKIGDRDPGTDLRASILVQLELIGETASRPVDEPIQLYGPSDVIGVDPRAISRTEPRPFISNFEPNYVAHIEFYDEDFPWRYSPAPADGDTKRLLPWLALIVLSETEFEDGTLPGRPLPYIKVRQPGALQRPSELGAWAHVHVNGELDPRLAVNDRRDMGTSLANLSRVLRESPDLACSRIVCPRHLSASTKYHAFLVPSFETGRRAGLGLRIEPGTIPAMTPAWGVDQTELPGELPLYHRWEFTTSTAGDFEYLVRLLKPIEAGEPVGWRDMDAHVSAGFGLPPVETTTEPHGVLKLGGALRLPDRVDREDPWENWDTYHSQQSQYPNSKWQQAMAGLINLAEAYQNTTAAKANDKLAEQIPKLKGEIDPVITPPLYGRWHALTAQLLRDDKGNPVPPSELRGWLHRLNLDPRFRVAANFGTEVVRKRQEELMAAAWNQLGDVKLANTKIRAAQLAREVGNTLHGKHFPKPPAQGLDADPLVSAKALTLAAPAHARVVECKQETVGFKVSQSRVATAPVSPAMRRIMRPGSRLMKMLKFPENLPPDKLVARIDEREVSAAPPRPTPEGLVTLGKLSGLHAAAPADDGRPKLGVGTTTADMMTGLNSEKTVLENLFGAMNLPDRLRAAAEDLTEVMAYPVFDMPMYEDLLKMSTDTLVPNLGLLPANTITLLENNRTFIESYLAGLNHEMARELLWREFPTDQRGTPFRQFWDPRVAVPSPYGPYDIRAMHEWDKATPLGENRNRPTEKNDLVLVIRGELLKKYPTAAVYAHKAVWPLKDGVPDKTGERTLSPDPADVKLPIYEAKVDPDITLLGFDLDADKARGGNGDLGWFFVIKERPGDPRFGLDEAQPGPVRPVEVWNDLTWQRVDPDGLRFIQFDEAVRVTLDKFNEDEDDQEKQEQRKDDNHIEAWQHRMSSADVAYILFQAPVLVAVHAQEMLPNARPQP